MAEQKSAIEQCVVVIAVHESGCLVASEQRLKPGDVCVVRFARLERNVAGRSRPNRKNGSPRAARVTRADVEQAVLDKRRGDGSKVRHSGKFPQERSVESV